MGSNGNAHDDPLNQRPATDREESAVRLFLSYAGVDRAYARTVAEALEAMHGVELFWDKKDLGWGDDWQQALGQALENCNAFLLLVSAGGVRHWTLAETRVALSRYFEAKTDRERLLILPLLLPEAKLNLLPPFLRSFQTETWPVEYPPDDVQAFVRWLLPRLRERLEDRRVALSYRVSS